MSARLPIRLRLTLPFAAAMAVVLAGMSLFVYLRVRAALMASVEQKLKSQLVELAGHAEHGTGLNDRDAVVASAVGEVVRGDGTVALSTPPGLPPLLNRRHIEEVRAGQSMRWSGKLRGLRGSWLVRAEPVQTSDGTETVVAAASLTARDETLDRLARELLVGGPLALAVAIIGGYLVAAAALRPVDAMRARASAITASTRGRRLPVPRGDDELSRLAATLNDMLERLEAAFEHERRFVADASHELRTPLALLRTELELAVRKRRSRDELERAVRSAAEETERLTRLAEDLLLIARSDQGQLPIRTAEAEAQEILEAVAKRSAGSADQQGRTIVVRSAGRCRCEVDRIRLEQALGNLVANALTYGAGTVELFVCVRDNALEFHVADEGKGFEKAFVPRAFDRFSRADEARGQGGAGLGLAIVHLIAEAHGGKAGIATRDGGGGDVWIAVPLERVRAHEPALSTSTH